MTKYNVGDEVCILRHVEDKSSGSHEKKWKVVKKKIEKVVDGINGINLYVSGKAIQEDELKNNTEIAEMDGDYLITYTYFLPTEKALRKAERWIRIANQSM